MCDVVGVFVGPDGTTSYEMDFHRMSTRMAVAAFVSLFDVFKVLPEATQRTVLITGRGLHSQGDVVLSVRDSIVSVIRSHFFPVTGPFDYLDRDNQGIVCLPPHVRTAAVASWVRIRSSIMLDAVLSLPSRSRQTTNWQDTPDVSNE